MVFVCENNLYMEYTPISDVTAVEHPAADRASAYGLRASSSTATTPTRSIAPRRPLTKARAGDGPSLIECMTYRHSGHSRADPAKYRPEGELEEWMKRDPMKIYRERLGSSASPRATIAAIETECKRKVDEATESARRRRRRRSISSPPTSMPTEAAAWRN